MQIVYGFEINGINYRVMDVNEALMNRDSVRSLSAYKDGVGADRVLFMDMVNNTVIAIFNANGKTIVPDMNDFQTARAIANQGQHREYHLTAYYLSVIAVDKDLRQTA